MAQDARRLKPGDTVLYRNTGANTMAKVLTVEDHKMDNETTEKIGRYITLDDGCGERFSGHLQVLMDAAERTQK